MANLAGIGRLGGRINDPMFTNPFLNPQQDPGMAGIHSSGLQAPGNALRPGAGGMATGPVTGLTPAPRPAPPPNAPTSFMFNPQQQQGAAAGGGTDPASVFARLMQQDPVAAYHYTSGGRGPIAATQWYQQNQPQIQQQYFSQGGPNAFADWKQQGSIAGDITPAQLAMFGDGRTMTGGSSGGLPQTGGAEPPMGGIVPTPAQSGPGYSLSGGLGAGGNIPLDIAKFLDPATGFRIGEATSAVENSAAARGGLLSGSTLRGVSDRASQVAGDEWSKATDRAFADRGFNYGVDVGDRDFARGAYESDRNFDFDVQRYNSDAAYRAAVDNRNFGYNVQTGDRDFNQRNLSELARLGLSGQQGNQAVLIRLAELLNSNILTGGGAGAAGAVGQGADLNAMISQIIRQLQGNMMVPPGN